MTRIPKLAKSKTRRFSKALDSDTDTNTPQDRIKSALMGGSYYDSGCRMLWTIAALTIFTYYAVYAMTTKREENGLLDCYTIGKKEQPVMEGS